MRKLLVVLLGFAIFLTACGKTGAATWQEQYDLGVRYLSEGKYEEAILAFTAAIEIDPKQEDAYLALAELYVSQGDPQRALEILEQALSAVGETSGLLAAKADLAPAPEPETEPEEEQQSGDRPPTREDRPDGSYVIYEYEGRNIRTTYYRADGTVECYWIYEFDDAGVQTRGTLYTPDGVMEKYVINTYGPDGARTGYTYYHADGRVEAYETNAMGIPSHCTITGPDGKVQIELTFDESGNLVKETQYNPDGTVAMETTH